MELGGVGLGGKLAWLYKAGGRAAVPNVPPPIQNSFAKYLVVKGHEEGAEEARHMGVRFSPHPDPLSP
jgi:hypothetical protein